MRNIISSKTSTVEFQGEDCLVITLEDGFMSRTYADDLKDYFSKVFLNRFHMEIDVIYQYAKKKRVIMRKKIGISCFLRVAQIEKI